MGFFGFGIPTMAVGAATALLWDGHTWLLKLLGWTGTMAGIVCGVAVLLLVAGCVFSQGTEPTVWPYGRILGFSLTALVCGGFGISMLFSAEGKSI